MFVAELNFQANIGERCTACNMIAKLHAIKKHSVSLKMFSQ